MARTSEPIKLIHVTIDGRKVRRYVAVADKPRKPGEKRRQVRRRFERMSDAKQWVADMRARVAAEAQPTKETVTFEQVATTWLSAKKRTVRPNTYRGYEDGAEVWNDAIGDKPVEDVSKSDIEALVTEYVAAGKSHRRVSFLLMVVRAILEDAVEEDLAPRNVARRVKPSGTPPKQQQAMTQAQVDKLKEVAASHELEALWLLSLCGLRRSEVMGLRWSDIDFDAKLLHVRRGRVQMGSKDEIDVNDPKTSNGFRTLPLPQLIIDALQRLRATQAEEVSLAHVREGYLALNEYGEPMTPEWYSDEWRRLCRDNGLPKITLHTARHTSVTIMRNMRVPDHDVAQWHGHDESIMRKTYSHSNTEGLKSAGAALFSDSDTGTGQV